MKNSNQSLLKNLSALLFFALLTVNLFAQTNFGGNWTFNESKSNFGESRYRFAATTMAVTQDANMLAVESTMPGRDGGEMKTSSKYNLDGTVSENPAFNTTRKSTVTWSADKTVLTISSVMTFERDGEKREMKSSETWTLSADGKVLTIVNVRPGREGGEMKTTVVYDKK